MTGASRWPAWADASAAGAPDRRVVWIVFLSARLKPCPDTNQEGEGARATATSKGSQHVLARGCGRLGM
jgi:hypothetical protein